MTQSLLPDFIELPLKDREPAWCVDGRPDFSKPKGPQMLGGSLLPILLSAIWKGIDFDEPTIRKEQSRLQEAGFSSGAHRGAHKNPDKSDCGFADRMPLIIQKAVREREEITKRLNAVYQKNSDNIGDLGKPFSEIVGDAFIKLEAYLPERIKLTSEELIRTVEKNGAIIGEVQGDHAEEVAFVNLKKGTTLDTNTLNEQGRQGFNLDLWTVAEQAERLGIDKQFAIGSSLILYQATEMVLVEAKGKPALPVVLHN